MKPVSIRDLAFAAGAVWRGSETAVADICTDTRELTPGCLFVALTGDNFDGHDYIDTALEKGAVAVLSEKAFGDKRIMPVKNTRSSLLGMAGYWRNLVSPKVVAITGSVGKTTTKEMTAGILSGSYKTVKTPENLNNEIGLSATVLSMPEDTGAAVLELGIDGPGQMAPLARCASPDVAIVTGIGITHLANFGSREALKREKLNIRFGMRDSSVILVCGDNDQLSDFSDRRLRVIRYGFENTECELRITGLMLMGGGGSTFRILWEGKEYPVSLPAAGVHNALDALAAFGAAVSLGVYPAAAAGALKDFVPRGMRQKIVRHKDFTVVEDCYNAGPESMRAALKTLAGMEGGRKIAILSDMLELGPKEIEEHRAVGEFAAKAGIDILLCTGSLAKEYGTGANSAGFTGALHFPSQENLFSALKDIIKPGDVLWLKGSRGMHLENLLERIYGI